MGYQIGNVCYSTKQEAENVYFSSVVPVVHTASNGISISLEGIRLPSSLVNRSNTNTLIKPDYINGKWQLDGKVLTANLPQCNPMKNFKDGAEIGSYFLVAAISLWAVILISKFLWKLQA